jgi:predicted metal-dependent hydrolase
MPSYRIQTHPRARHVRLRVDRLGQVVVTVPPGFDRRRVAALVSERKAWIEAVQGRFQRVRGDLVNGLSGLRPERVELPAVDECWTVEYRPCQRRNVGFQADERRLVFRLPPGDSDSLDERIAEKLRAWLMNRARQRLPSMVDDLAEQFGFKPGRITIRNQRSRWGSCSARGNLSLNARLLLASPAACRYVLIHELVHLEHPNHSRAFWRRVGQLEPDYRDAGKELRELWVRLPEWVGF